VIRLSLEEVARLCPGRLDRRANAGEITGVQIDSRRIGDGDLFVAVAAGADFCADALAHGAAATLVPDDAHAALAALGRAVRGRSAARFVGITGSAGKTSTKDILAALCASQAETVASERSYNAELGVPLTLCRVEETTEICILELAMRGLGQIASLCEIARPEVGLITNVGPAHVELVGSVEAVARAKGELIEALPPGGVAIVPEGLPLPGGRDDLDVRRFGANQILSLEPEDGGTRGTYAVGARRLELWFSFTARHQALNALAALHAYEALGLPLDRLDRVEVEFSAWRGEELPLPGGGLLINDCWNANPLSMRAALEHLVARAEGRRTVAVLGDMAELGPEAPAYHREIGGLVRDLGIDVLFAVGALAEGYLDDASRVAWWQDSFDLEPLLERLRAELQPGDCVLVKASRAVGLEAVAEALVAVHR
jgi:UDP-N-acetylmuramoyl-tripeptide--D-alanyl-D-alanine ligase